MDVISALAAFVRGQTLGQHHAKTLKGLCNLLTQNTGSYQQQQDDLIRGGSSTATFWGPVGQGSPQEAAVTR